MKKLICAAAVIGALLTPPPASANEGWSALQHDLFAFEWRFNPADSPAQIGRDLANFRGFSLHGATGNLAFAAFGAVDDPRKPFAVKLAQVALAAGGAALAIYALDNDAPRRDDAAITPQTIPLSAEAVAALMAEMEKSDPQAAAQLAAAMQAASGQQDGGETTFTHNGMTYQVVETTQGEAPVVVAPSSPNTEPVRAGDDGGSYCEYAADHPSHQASGCHNGHFCDTYETDKYGIERCVALGDERPDRIRCESGLLVGDQCITSFTVRRLQTGVTESWCTARGECGDFAADPNEDRMVTGLMFNCAAAGAGITCGAFPDQAEINRLATERAGISLSATEAEVAQARAEYNAVWAQYNALPDSATDSQRNAIRAERAAKQDELNDKLRELSALQTDAARLDAQMERLMQTDARLVTMEKYKFARRLQVCVDGGDCRTEYHHTGGDPFGERFGGAILTNIYDYYGGGS